MAQVEDGLDVQPPHLRQDVVGPGPVVVLRAEEGLVQGGAPAEELDAQLVDQGQVLPPAPVVAALVHLIDADPTGNRRAAVLDAGGEHENQA
jgi:hypothetical protein